MQNSVFMRKNVWVFFYLLKNVYSIVFSRINVILKWRILEVDITFLFVLSLISLPFGSTIPSGAI